MGRIDSFDDGSHVQNKNWIEIPILNSSISNAKKFHCSALRQFDMGRETVSAATQSRVSETMSCGYLAVGSSEFGTHKFQFVFVHIYNYGFYCR